MFSSLPQRFQIPPRYARPPLQKGAFGSPPLAKEGQGGFRQQYRVACALQKFVFSARTTENRSNRLLKKGVSCFDRLSTNGKSPTTSSLPSFALSLSKGERRVFQHPAKGFARSPYTKV